MHITRQKIVNVLPPLKQLKTELTDILWLDISVNEVTLFMEIPQTEKDLFGDTFNDTRSDPFPAILLYEGKEVFAEWLKSNAYVGRRREHVRERLEKVDDMDSSGMRR